MSMKKMLKFDGVDLSDSTSINRDYYDTEIIIKSLDTGEVLFKGKNKVVVAGGETVARKLFDLSDSDAHIIPNYNQELEIPDPPGAEDAGVDYIAEYGTSAKPGDPKVLLFCIGEDGCGTEGSQVYQVEYNSRIRPESLIPFRYKMLSTDFEIDSALRKVYVGRKVDGDYVAYYFKRFSSDPTLVRVYADGTNIDSGLYASGLDIEQYVSLNLIITKDDMREYFIATRGIDECKLNTISLCSAYVVQCDGIPYYMDIRPFTKLNFPNEYMIDVTKGIEIIYHIYF